jgi:predicted nuclease of predicted toxin-antitoxin system
VRFLADESCDFAVVRALRAAGHDVAAIAEEQPGLTDRDVIARAGSESRIVLAEDKDFGQLSFSAGGGSVGCVLLRFPAGVRASLGADVVQLVETLGDRLLRSFVTAEPGRTRITRLPGSG